MTKLLVSVRNAAEARIALAGGADLIDVKEPSRGPLGAADPATIEAVVAEVAGRAPTSAALGELQSENRISPRQAGGVDYAKFGLAGCLDASDWAPRLQAVVESLAPRVVAVAVAYADWQSARAPDPWDILSRARSIGCGALLVDTFDKTAGPLGQHMARADLARWVAEARGKQLMCVVAGRLGPHEIDEILPYQPDYIGVRGAACRGGRTGHLDSVRLRRLADLVHCTNGCEDEGSATRSNDR
jgi:(5-formylfuran-3-yl)methyl phosphate synthase